MTAAIQQFDFTAELEKSILSNITTTFGLDFLLFQDKLGGDVDTVHNVRQGIWATEKEKKAYEDRGPYDSQAVHSDRRYTEFGKAQKQKRQEGVLRDGYSGRIFKPGDPADIDHSVSGKESHDDPGRVLADLSTEDLVNCSSNLVATSSSVNRSKGDLSAKEFVAKLPERIAKTEQDIQKKQERLQSMPEQTPQQRHEKRQLEAEIAKDKNKLEKLQEVDPELMLQRDEEARKAYEAEVNWTYYSSSKFLKNTGKQAVLSGVRLAARQVLGLVLAEVWFELREQLPKLWQKMQAKCLTFQDFIRQTASALKDLLQGIWHRVKLRFSDFLTEFQGSFFAGLMSSISSTVTNIFATTLARTSRMMRQLWFLGVKGIKAAWSALNAKQSKVQVCRAFLAALLTSVGYLLGESLDGYLSSTWLATLPFGQELSAVISAVVTALTSVSLTYACLYSEGAQKIWALLESPYAQMVQHYERINAELDSHLQAWGQLEFNIDVQQWQEFAQSLHCAWRHGDEQTVGQVLQSQLKLRGVDLGFELGDADSARRFLKSLW